LHDLPHHPVIWRADHTDDLVQLISVVSPTEDRDTADHLGEAEVMA
jgi:hypothetical protein